MRTLPVTRSISTPQKSKMKPWQREELISSASVGAVSSGGVQNTVSRIAPAASSGTSACDQWLVAATRANGSEASGIARDGGGCLGAVLRASLAALGSREHGRDIAHVGDAGFDCRGQADAVETSCCADLVAPPLQVVEPAVVRGDLERAGVIAGIVESAGRRAIRERR